MKWLLTAFFCAMSAFHLAAATQPVLGGRIVDSKNKPIAHATVMVYHAGVKVGYSTYCPSCYRDCGKRVTTDKNGAFAIRGLDPDLWFTLLAVDDGYVPNISSKFDPAQNIGVKIVLASRSASLLKTSIARGRVTDSDGTPIQDVVVEPLGLIVGDSSSYGTIQGLDPLAVSNVMGEFELSYRGTSPAMLVTVEGRGFAPRFAKLTTGASRTTLVVSEGATIHGILTSNGKPIRNAEVGLIAKVRGGYANDLTVFEHPYPEQRIGTATDGSFLISNVPEPATWLLYGKMSTMPKGEGTKPLEIRTSHDKQYLDKVDLASEPAHSVTGKVLLSDGHSIPDGMRLTFASANIWDSQVVVLSRDGSFHIGNVPDGDFCMIPSVKGYETRGVPMSDCEVPVSVAGKDLQGIRVVVYPLVPRP